MNGKLLLKHMAKWKLLYVVTLMASLSFVGVNAFDVYAPTVKSDKDDYAPGEVAIITGYGWTQDEYVDIHFEETPAYHGEHEHDFHDVKVNADGTWRIEYQIEDRHLGVAFDVTVVGQQSGATAHTYFTDAPSITSITPDTGPTLGNTEVTVTGRGLFVNNWNLEIKFGEITATEKPNSRTTTGQGNNQLQSVTVYSPAQAAGVYDVKAVMTRTTGQTQIEESNTIPYTYYKSSATLILSSLVHTYDGNAKSATVTTNPAGLSGVAVTYNGSSTAPTTAGTYEVVAILNNANYEAEPVTGSLVISKATANVELADLEHTYNGNAKSASASTDATGISSFSFTYDGSTELPVNYKAGGYAVVATLVNDNYSGSATGTLLINKADQIIAWSNPASIEYGTALSSTQLNATLTAGDGTLTYNPALETILNAGNEQTLTVSAAETNNYNAATASVSIDVTKATPIVNLTVGGPYDYDGDVKSVTSATVTGIGGADLGAVTVAYEQNGVSIASPVNAGTYDVTASYAGNANYTTATATGTLVINKAVASLTLSNLSGHTYDGTPKYAVVTTEPAGISGATIENNGQTNSGRYYVLASLDNPNYEAEPTEGFLIISNATLTIKADNASRIYGDENPAFTGSVVSGAAHGETFNVTASSAALSSSNVGAYDITPSVTGTTLVNYDVIVNKGTLTVTERPITVTADAGQKKVYGEPDPTAYTYQITSGNLVDDSHLTGALTRASGDNVGSYAIAQGSLATTANYALTYTSADFEITKRSVTVAADAKSKIYGEEDPALTYSITDGSLVGTDVFSGALSRVPGEQVGTYAIEQGTLSLGTNYNLGFAGNAVLGITPKAITVTPNADQNKVYGTADPVLAYTHTSLVGADSFFGALSRELGNDVGAYDITIGTLALSINYTLNFVSGVPFNITRKALTASLVAADKVYDGTTSASATGSVPAADVVDGDDVTVVVENAAFDTKNAGIGKTVTADISIANSNYSLTNATASTTANITAKPITGDFAAADKVYDGTNVASVTGRSLEGVIGQDDVQLTGGNATFSDKNAAIGKVVTLTGASLSGDDKDNYELTEVSTAVAAISPRPITVTAEAKTKVYGDNDPALTHILKAGSLVQGETLTGELQREYGENVGVYAINQNSLTAGANYIITYESANLTITSRAIAITADAQSKTYGDLDPATLTYQITAGELINGDSFTGSLSRVAGENVGSYAITQGNVVLSTNYALTYNGANLSINPLGVTVSAEAKEKYCGQADPALTFVSSPAVGAQLANGDLISFTGSLTREAGEAVGSYAINQGTLANSNYTIAYNAAKLDVLGVSIDASASSSPVALGSSATLSATVTADAVNVNGVPVTFTVKNEAGTTVHTKTVTTDGSGIATDVVPSSVLSLGVYKVEAVAGSGCSSSEAYIPVFDASGSFVTGGGWINSPAGAMPANPDATGKANFGFVSKYKKGSSQVDGNTEFQFSAGSINFKSTMHESGSLVISGGKATYRGSGTVNNESGFKFTIVAIDGDWKDGGKPDRFRIKIVNSKGEVVYDNQIGSAENTDDATVLGNNGSGGGSIVIHEAKELTTSNGKKLESAQQLEGLSSARFDNYPNAFADQTTIRFAFDTEQSFTLEVYDIRGALVKKVATGKAEAGQVYEYELDARNLAEGVYFARLATGSKIQTIKMLLKK
jgi:hypothetical protein